MKSNTSGPAKIRLTSEYFAAFDALPAVLRTAFANANIKLDVIDMVGHARAKGWSAEHLAAFLDFANKRSQEIYEKAADQGFPEGWNENR